MDFFAIVVLDGLASWDSCDLALLLLSSDDEDRGYFYDTAWNLNFLTNNGSLATYRVDVKNDLTNTTSTGSLCYDLNGNMTNAGSSGITYEYDDGNLDANQSMVASYRYDPFGNLISKSGSLADTNLYRFSSKEFNVNTGLYYYGFRFYDPLLERWLNQDPVQELGGNNLYTFARNSPLHAVDCLGLCADDDLTECFLKVLERYSFAQAKESRKAVARHLLWTVASGLGTATGGLAVIVTGGGVLGTPTGAVAETALLINDIILGVVLVHEMEQAEKQAKKNFRQDLDACATKSSEPNAKKQADDFYKKGTGK